jgi:hypothetical protein
MPEVKEEIADDYREWIESAETVYNMQAMLQKMRTSDPQKMAELRDSKEFQDYRKASQRHAKKSEIFKKNNGLAALAQMPEKSLQTWSGLSASRREELMEEYTRLPLQRIILFAGTQAHGLEEYVSHIEFYRAMRQALEKSKQTDTSGK